MTIKVVAENFVRPEAVEAFMAAAYELVAETVTKDDGCVAYGLWRDKANPLHFTVLEEWLSQAALDAHMASSHFQRLVPLLGPACDPAQPGGITVYEPA